LNAIQILADAPDALAGPSLIQAWTSAPPHLRTAILDALINRGKRLGYLLQAFEMGKIPHHALLPLQRTQLLERADGHLRPRLEAAFVAASNTDQEAIFNRYASALSSKSDAQQGQILFQQMCSPCHRIGQIGVAVGPDLKNSFANSNETILRNLLFPSERIASGYDIYTVLTTENQTHSGILVSESANSIVLKQAGGKEQTFLRKNIQKLNTSSTSLMPTYIEVLSPGDCANVIAWMKQSLTTKEK
jgi:putative heme-binding domain-containing protein